MLSLEEIRRTFQRSGAHVRTSAIPILPSSRCEIECSVHRFVGCFRDRADHTAPVRRIAHLPLCTRKPLPPYQGGRMMGTLARGFHPAGKNC